jgi:hypothetical protein
MEVFALFGCVLYEGDDLLGVYSSLEAAQAARDAYRLQERLEDEDYFCEYDEFRIRALRVDDRALAVPFFVSL